MHALYAFCREVDDIADEPGTTVADRQRALDGWRDEVAELYAGRPRWPTTRALLGPVRRFELPREEFLAVIDGMTIDAAPAVRMRDLGELLRYCRKVAGAVGMLSIHVFGVSAPPAPRVAVSLGYALQLTNILRDLEEDAARGRLYVPLEVLGRHGVGVEQSLGLILTHPGFDRACGELARLARSYFAEAERLIASLGPRKRRMRPAVLMMAVYRELLGSLESRGWRGFDRPVRLTRARKAWLALRYGLL